ncbi:methyl-accepting chemotaxis protein [Fundidesulfovibrio terrae]|uniref:methyl-accepting chemotaxis protein n=1 Tax=Fundidesulfovibrio terrae TaxID=2922866 RepID=UPI001FAEEBFE
MKIQLSLRAKLVIFCLAIGILPLAFMGVYSVRQASGSLSQQAFGQLESVRDSRREALRQQVDKWLAEVRIYASVKEVYNAIGMLRDIFMGKSSTGVRNDVSDPEFAEMVQFVAPAFEPFVSVLGYRDALLVDEYGRVIFSVSKGLELGEDLDKGPLKDSGLARSWRKAMQGRTVFEDFAPYQPLGNAPAAFVASPVHNHVGGIDGVALLRIAPEDLASIMASRSGKDETGESFLTGADRLMRTDSASHPDTHSVAASFADPARGRMDIPAVARALEGHTGSEITVDVAGKAVLAAYTPVKAGDATWALVTVIDKDEAFAAVRRLTNASLILGLCTAAIILACSVAFLRREIVRPFDSLRLFLDRIAKGDFQAELTGRFKAEMAVLSGGITRMVGEIKNKLGFSQGILQAMTLPCMVTSPEGKVAFVNAPLLELLELDLAPAECAGMDVDDFFAATPSLADAPRRSFAEKHPVRGVELEGRGARGWAFFVRQDCAPLYDLDAVPLGTFTLFTDLTGIKDQEALIRRQNEKITQVAEQANLIAMHVSQGAEELSGQVESIREGAHHQTTRLAETSRAMDEMNAALVEVARVAGEAAGSSDAASGQAGEGSQVVAHCIDSIDKVFSLSNEHQQSMNDLGDKATSIGRIIGVIDDIADQTNLLALNAAIEAARAGDAGRGFAVVADEVRKLAEKTQNATREVSQSIAEIQRVTRLNIDGTEKSFEAISQANSLVKRSGDALARIVDYTSATADQVRRIAASAEEQSSAHHQVNGAVSEVNEIAQETSLGMVDTAEAVTYLAAQASELRELIDSMVSGDQGAPELRAAGAPALESRQGHYPQRRMLVM